MTKQTGELTELKGVITEGVRLWGVCFSTSRPVPSFCAPINGSTYTVLEVCVCVCVVFIMHGLLCPTV